MKNFPEIRRGLYDPDGKLKPVSAALFDSDFNLVLRALSRKIQQFRLTSQNQRLSLRNARLA